MNKEQAKQLIAQYGQAIITYRSLHSRKQKYNVGTFDRTNSYIRRKPLKIKETPQTILLFCWDADCYRLIRVNSITSIVPLGWVLNNAK